MNQSTDEMKGRTEITRNPIQITDKRMSRKVFSFIFFLVKIFVNLGLGWQSIVKVCIQGIESKLIGNRYRRCSQIRIKFYTREKIMDKKILFSNVFLCVPSNDKKNKIKTDCWINLGQSYCQININVWDCLYLYIFSVFILFRCYSDM